MHALIVVVLLVVAAAAGPLPTCSPYTCLNIFERGNVSNPVTWNGAAQYNASSCSTTVYASNLAIYLTMLHNNLAVGDYVTIYAGYNQFAPLLINVTRSTPIGSVAVTSTSNMFIQFTSTSSVTDLGYQFQVSAQPPQQCSGSLNLNFANGTSGVISNPYPYGSAKYNPSANCQWSLHAPAGSRFLVSINGQPDFANCIGTALNIYDGTNTYAPSFVSINSSPQPFDNRFMTSGQDLYITFSAPSYTVTGYGFSLNYSVVPIAPVSVCSGQVNLTGTYGTGYTQTGYPNSAMPGGARVCNFLVQGARNGVAAIRFSDVYLYYTTPFTQYADEVQVFDGPDATFAEILPAQIIGSKNATGSKWIVGTGNALYIRLTKQGAAPAIGFSFDYNTTYFSVNGSHCVASTYYSTSQYISGPSFYRGTSQLIPASDRTCKWYTSGSYRVRLDFQVLDLPYSTISLTSFSGYTYFSYYNYAKFNLSNGATTYYEYDGSSFNTYLTYSGGAPISTIADGFRIQASFMPWVCPSSACNGGVGAFSGMGDLVEVPCGGASWVPGQLCKYSFQVPAGLGYAIELILPQFSGTGGGYIAIFDGLTEASPLILNYTGIFPLANVFGTRYNLLVHVMQGQYNTPVYLFYHRVLVQQCTHFNTTITPTNGLLSLSAPAPYTGIDHTAAGTNCVWSLSYTASYNTPPSFFKPSYYLCMTLTNNSLAVGDTLTFSQGSIVGVATSSMTLDASFVGKTICNNNVQENIWLTLTTASSNGYGFQAMGYAGAPPQTGACYVSSARAPGGVSIPVSAPFTLSLPCPYDAITTIPQIAGTYMWNLTAADPVHTQVQVQLLLLSTMSGYPETLYIYDLGSGAQLGASYGYTIDYNTLFTGSSGSIRVTLPTGGTSLSAGFLMQVSPVPINTCGVNNTVYSAAPSGGLFTMPSPFNGVAQYGANQRCSWTIVPPSTVTNKGVFINVTYTDIGAGDTIQIYDVEKGILVATNPPLRWTYQAAFDVMIVFNSDASGFGTGFRIAYKYVQISLNCTAGVAGSTVIVNVTSTPQFIGVPCPFSGSNWPYGNTYSWSLQVPNPGMQSVQLTFLAASGGSSDVWSLYDGVSVGSPSQIVFQYTGSSTALPRIDYTYQSKSGQMFLQVAESSFGSVIAQVVLGGPPGTLQCNGYNNVVNSTQVISNPSPYDGVTRYVPNSACVWTVLGRVGFQTVIKLTNFTLGAGDQLLFSYQNTMSYPIIHYFDNTTTNPKILAPFIFYDTVYIKFTSDADGYTGYGFSFNVDYVPLPAYTDCPGVDTNLTLPFGASGRFSYPCPYLFNGSYPATPGVHTWWITGPIGSVIHMYTLNNAFKSPDVISFYDGYINASTLLITTNAYPYQTALIQTSKSNVMVIQLNQVSSSGVLPAGYLGQFSISNDKQTASSTSNYISSGTMSVPGIYNGIDFYPRSLSVTLSACYTVSKYTGIFIANMSLAKGDYLSIYASAGLLPTIILTGQVTNFTLFNPTVNSGIGMFFASDSGPEISTGFNVTVMASYILPPSSSTTGSTTTTSTTSSLTTTTTTSTTSTTTSGSSTSTTGASSAPGSTSTTGALVSTSSTTGASTSPSTAGTTDGSTSSQSTGATTDPSSSPSTAESDGSTTDASTGTPSSAGSAGSASTTTQSSAASTQTGASTTTPSSSSPSSSPSTAGQTSTSTSTGASSPSSGASATQTGGSATQTGGSGSGTTTDPSGSATAAAVVTGSNSGSGTVAGLATPVFGGIIGGAALLIIIVAIVIVAMRSRKKKSHGMKNDAFHDSSMTTVTMASTMDQSMSQAPLNAPPALPSHAPPPPAPAPAPSTYMSTNV